MNCKQCGILLENVHHSRKYCQKCRQMRDNISRLKARYKYNNSEKGKQNRQQYRMSTQGKKSQKIAQAKYIQTEKGRINKRKVKQTYQSGVKGKRHHIVRHLTRYHFGTATMYFCVMCGVKAETWHHFTYDETWKMNVVPVCRICHYQIHTKN